MRRRIRTGLGRTGGRRTGGREADDDDGRRIYGLCEPNVLEAGRTFTVRIVILSKADDRTFLTELRTPMSLTDLRRRIDRSNAPSRSRSRSPPRRSAAT